MEESKKREVRKIERENEIEMSWGIEVIEALMEIELDEWVSCQVFWGLKLRMSAE